MHKKWVIVSLSVVAAVVLVGIGYYFASYRAGNGGSGSVSGSPSDAFGMRTSATAQPLPSSSVIQVPEENATSAPSGVAIPSLVSTAGPSATNVSYRVFNLNVSSAGFSPDTIIVRQGDTMHINVTAIGGNYDFTQQDYGVSIAIPKGQTKFLQFDAVSTGKFTFYCKSCGGPAKGPVGYIEVTAK